MKRKYWLMLIYVILIVWLGISLYKIFYPKSGLLGEQYQVLYKPLYSNIEKIENNMNEITISNNDFDWWKLKETNIEDERLVNTYNLLVKDIRTCYLKATDIKNKTYKSTKVLSFKNKRSISNDQILELESNENCLKTFNKYNSMVLSNDSILSERIKNQISIIIDYQKEINYDGSFYTVLYEELVEVNKIANLSNWLKVEYNSRKNN